MALTPGTRLGPYEITAQIGVGGMGEVYRATDTTLNRQVAIKVLPESLASDAERVARFEREAKTLASLNHPNIAQIYGFEKSSGVHALVMELVEGPTPADHLGYCASRHDQREEPVVQGVNLCGCRREAGRRPSEFRRGAYVPARLQIRYSVSTSSVVGPAPCVSSLVPNLLSGVWTVIYETI